MSERIRVVAGPWPERIGLEGHIVVPTPEQARVYPFAGRGKHEVIVMLDGDPHTREGAVFSCAMKAKDVVRL